MASKRPALPKVSEEVRRWSALLLEEVKRWPGTRVGSMFGMVSVYRGDTIFALLPATRAVELPNAIAIKSRGAGSAERPQWQSVAIANEAGLGAALKRLSDAYQDAAE